ncbi:diaminopropionate ammonia-lyase [Taklimakanibacter deserti]|uniref:diaminopropionate ammonia-lyase n=1 Tax=Taklimakanibacter deserti TaxID=2267839 RepID=UPI000E654A50
MNNFSAMIDNATAVIPAPGTRPKLGPLPWWCAADAAAVPRQFLKNFPHHPPTPLLALDALAARLGIGSLHAKDESFRLGLSSFKGLGGAYAVMRVAQKHAEAALGRPVLPHELLTPEIRALSADLTFCCASDGNHGRSVAAGARLIGARCTIFLHAGVSEERVAHIERLGATIVRIDGSYDDSIAEAARSVDRRGSILVPDIVSAGDPETAQVCGHVMQGYSILVDEVFETARERKLDFTHVFVQAGVGGLAASVLGHWSALAGQNGTPRFVIVEPERAACLTESAKAQRLVTLPHGPSTVMAMLECQSASPLAWPIVHALADAYITVAEEDARQAVKHLAWPKGVDPVIEAGESGAAGLAGLERLLADKTLAAQLGLDGKAKVLVIVTEGPTDRSQWSGRTRQ